MNSTRNIAGLALLIVSLILYVIGITTPFMNFTISFNMKEMMDVPFLGGLLSGMQEKTTKTITYTIIEAIRSLIENGQIFVAFLLGFFGVVIPLLKTLFSITTLVFYKKPFALGLHRFNGLITKFAMADVFTIGIFIAFLYTRFNEFIKADIRDGYYFFVGYCLLSIISNMLIKLPKKEVAEA